MKHSEAVETIRLIAQADYDGTEPDISQHEAEHIIKLASRPGYSTIDGAPEAIETLGVEAAAKAYVEALDDFHAEEYAEDDAEFEKEI